jgi:hypothetical protein
MQENLCKKALTAFDGIFKDNETIEIEVCTYHMDYTGRRGL